MNLINLFLANRNQPKPSTRSGPVIPQTDFDFENSNAKFSKSSTMNDESGASPVYYEKSSFFDDISCDSKEKTAG